MQWMSLQSPRVTNMADSKPRGIRAIFLGPPGAGKGTQVDNFIGSYRAVLTCAKYTSIMITLEASE